MGAKIVVKGEPETTSRPALSVVAAVIWRQVRSGSGSVIEVLVFQRQSADIGGGSWEFPGGKIDSGETPEQALQREIQEELSVTVRVGQLLGQNRHQYPQALIDLSAYHCEPLAANFEQAIQLSEHTAFRWVNFEQIQKLPMSLADVPLVAPVFKAAEGYFRRG